MNKIVRIHSSGQIYYINLAMMSNLNGSKNSQVIYSVRKDHGNKVLTFGYSVRKDHENKVLTFGLYSTTRIPT